MVFLALTRPGLDDALALAKHAPISIWCSANAISEEEFDALAGADLTRFTYALDSTAEALDDALTTIEEHHPGQRLWIEGHGTACESQPSRIPG